MRTCRLSRRLLLSCVKRSWQGSAPLPTLPFLYETSTIRNFSGTSRSAVPESRSGSRAKGVTNSGEHVPFENAERKPRWHSRPPGVEKDESSLSVTERDAFTDLFGRLGNSDTQHSPEIKDSGKKRRQWPKKRKPPPLSPEEQDAYMGRLPPSIRSLAKAALDRITAAAADKVRNTVQRDGDEATLQSEGQATLQPEGQATLQPERRATVRLEEQATLRPEEEAILWPEEEATLRPEEEADAKLERYLKKIKALLSAQETDVGAWKILQREIFEPLKLLNLDGHLPQPEPRQTRKKDKPTAKAPPEMMLAGIPHVALLAVNHIHRRYPASQLPLSILPQLKRIAKTAHALALSPELYASILSIDWRRSSSPSNTISILQEMEAEGVELDRDVLASLSSIVQEAQLMQAGGHGATVQLVCGVEGWADKLTELSNEWIALVRQRIVDAAVKEAHEHEEGLLRGSEAAPSREDGEDGTADVVSGG